MKKYNYLNDIDRYIVLMVIDRLNYLPEEKQEYERHFGEVYIKRLYREKLIDDFQFKDLWEAIH